MTTPLERRQDRVRREWYLLRFDMAMQGYPSAARKALHDELRAEIEAATADVGPSRALPQLGSPRGLADAYYAELGRPCPRPLDGAVVAALVGFAIALSWLSYALGSIDTLGVQGGGTAELSFLAVELTTRGGPGGMGLESSFSWPSLMLLMTVLAGAFALGSRSWRALPTFHPRPHEEHP
ncbi:hypothetical protein J4G33_10850 [Actinotalea sp. BY-33]|uniref:Uncharacterized protein n=1 Tax=Actinotalea soli TaxID=2819234 RepID=A0A939LSM3_9CELL|nr:hypothetical protein [Actinotalea soli]MBO1752300.1 hypothetical protein [Actinotalea soli]